MGCRKLSYYQEKGTLGESLSFLGGGLEKSASVIKKVHDYSTGGSIMPGRSFSANSYRYGFNQGSEKDDEITGVTGSHFTTYFREFDTRLLRPWSPDPVFQPWQSPYSYMDGNPIWFNDPLGDSTFVTAGDKGTYSVVGGNLAGDDKGIYIQGTDGKLTGERLGESLTTHSFVDADENFVTGAIIDHSSTGGQDFIDDEIIGGDPSLVGYMWNARNGKDYDFKDRGIDNRGSQTRQQYRYRGSVTKDGKYGSARDFGNVGAGIVAGRKGLTWDAARYGFDTYQGAPEPTTTQKAQRYGFGIGIQLKRSDEIQRQSEIRNNPGLLKPWEPKY
jgi:hypothetical protein